jgi:hypothetical protein
MQPTALLMESLYRPYETARIGLVSFHSMLTLFFFGAPAGRHAGVVQAR